MSESQAQNVLEKKDASKSARGKRLLWFGVFIVTVLICVIFAIAFHSVNTTRKSLEEEVRIRQRNLVQSRLYAVETWLKDSVNKAHLLADSDFFQLFAAEVDKLPHIPLLFKPEEDEGGQDAFGNTDQPSSRLPLMMTQLTEFAAYANFQSARIVNSRGEPYLSTETSLPPFTEHQKDAIKKVISTGQVVFGSIAKCRSGMTMNVYVPILAPIYERQNKPPVAVLILTQLVDATLIPILRQEQGNERGRELHLVQLSPDGFQDVVPATLELRTVNKFPGEGEDAVPFALRDAGVSGNKRVYSSGIKLSLVDWWLIAEDNASLLLSRSQSYAKTIYSLAALISLVLTLMVIAVWWWLIGREQASINSEIRNLFSVIEDQKKLLDGINNTISDPISLTDTRGVYQYVNRAFANAVGRTESEVVGLDIPAVFGFDTAKRLNAADQHVLMTGESISVQDIIWLQSRRFIFQISKAPLRDVVSRNAQGIVSVFRDITPLVETQEKSRRVVQQTIDALVRTIEQADPFLGGHSRIMGGIALLIAKQLRLSETDIATIAAAANLSQIGKMFVPREILLKPGALTPEEKKLMEQHVEHTRSILSSIEFDLPVVDAIYQINERLDGHGYPQGLSGDAISMHARVLAVANAFAAMARPRAYRPAIPIEEALTIMEKQSTQYDPAVVQALREVLKTPAGERLAEQAAGASAH